MMKKWSRTQKRAALALILAVAALCAGVIFIVRGQREEVVYRETAVHYGELTVGITESGSVDMGTVDQVFELDMSALQRADAQSSTGTSGSSGTGFAQGSGIGAGRNSAAPAAGGLNMFQQLFSMADGERTSDTTQTSGLPVAEVYVSIGQQIEEGAPLYRLEAESVSLLEERLKSNVEKAKADLDAVYAQQELSKETAENTYHSNTAYGSYAAAEYQAAVRELEDTVSKKQEELEKAQTLHENYQKQLEETSADYEIALEVLNQCVWSRDHTDKWQDTGNYVLYFQMAREAQSTADTLEATKERLEDSLEQAEKNIETCHQELSAAKRNLAQGKLTAQETYNLRTLAYSTAQETYDLAYGYLAREAEEQEEIYAAASVEWEEFSSHISGDQVVANKSGVITSVNLATGDMLNTGSTLVTLYDTEEVSVTVTLAEEDAAAIQEDLTVKVLFAAYPDTPYQAQITEIADASADSSGNVTADITVTLLGDVSGLFQGMTGEVTFVTKEVRQVLYVSNRAIFREGARSYVKVKDADGRLYTKEVVTGFSDGVNVEIKEGLEDGEIVLIESKL
ncbi:MAG: HlyD family efflux transporter periplasmic adaptor subunit [Clostridium sp.]|jgi:HlyD family secretion protein|nr:HlyD family efflux transporter periplasmic adaptor subunit [Clostridium sp.]